MSAFIVDERVIREIVTWISEEIATNPYTPIKRLLTEYGLPLEYDWENKLATQMHQLNHDAVAYRYDEEHEEVSLEHLPVQASPIQVFKRIHCWQYQCSEGDYDTSPLYRLSEQVMGVLASKIVSELPAYDKAKWG